MKYTVRFAHLDKAPLFKAGDIVLKGAKIGMMGSSGQSTAAHLHIDCAIGEHKKHYTLADMDDDGDILPAPRQLLHFIDADLFGVDPIITTTYAEFEYFLERGKVHFGFDVVPKDRKLSREHYMIHWNRTCSGKVTLVEDDPKGYGHCIYISFER